MNEIIIQIFRLTFIGIFNFFLALILMPLFLKIIQKFNIRKEIRREEAPIFQSLHQKKAGTLTMGGIIFWLTTAITSFIFWFGGEFFHIDIFKFLNFVERRETFLPIFSLIFSGVVGLVDDLLGRVGLNKKNLGLRIKEKLIIYFSLAILGAWWFVAKLNFTTLNIDGLFFYVGPLWFSLVFIFIFLATSFSANETDGLDGLLAGISSIILVFFLVIAFINGDYNLSAFTVALLGSLLAFLWFNIYPAKIFMGDTGSMSLGVTIALLSFLTGTSLLLPIIAPIFVIESGSVIIQIVSKKLRHKKIFFSTPIHHHFEAKGWLEPTIVFRFWLINFLGCLISFLIYLSIKFLH